MKASMQIIGAVAIAVSGLVYADETVYVQSFKTKLFAAPEFRAAVVGEAARGQALTVLESTDRWSRVKLGTGSGWVPSLAVSHHVPLRSTALDGAADNPLAATARRRASGATTAGAARGLTYEDRMRAHKAGIANYAAAERMESFSVSEEEALAFVASGLKP